jgi:hypothetical protein
LKERDLGEKTKKRQLSLKERDLGEKTKLAKRNKEKVSEKTGLEEKTAEEGKQEEKKDSKKIDYSKQTKQVVLIMIVALIAMAITYFMVQGDKTAKYHDLVFSKEESGGIVEYKTLLGYAVGGESRPLTLQLRTDPEKLEKIPADADIKLLKNTLVSLAPEIVNCSNIYPTLIDLSMTLTTFGTTPKIATTDRDLAIEKNVTLADCRSSLNQTVIILQRGNQTQVVQEFFFTNCYYIEVNNCEIREGYERFLLEYIEDNLLEKE